MIAGFTLFAATTAGADTRSRFATEALMQVEKMLENAFPAEADIETYVDCDGQTVYVQRAEQRCPQSLRTVFVVEQNHSLVATYCLRPKEDPRVNRNTQAYFDRDGKLSSGWLVTTRRPSREFLRHLRCQLQANRQ
jgi:uncharacterized lipoprotein NlpE involved in copper resistance